MLKNKSIFFLVGLLAVSCSDPSLNKPLTHSDDLVEVIHGKSIADPYRWLEDFTSDKLSHGKISKINILIHL